MNKKTRILFVVSLVLVLCSFNLNHSNATEMNEIVYPNRPIDSFHVFKETYKFYQGREFYAIRTYNGSTYCGYMVLQGFDSRGYHIYSGALDVCSSTMIR